MHAEIISIGDELILGHTVDTNVAWLSRRLAELGIEVTHHVTIGDQREAIAEAIAQAARGADLVLITGGLGPTEDDVTRHGLADAMGVDLVFDGEMGKQIEEFFRQRHRPMQDRNRVQAMFPAGSEPIPNSCGTAPGIHGELDGARVFAMPGVPREMRVMYERSVLGRLRHDLRRGDRVILCRCICCFGAGESDIGAAIVDLMQRGRNPSVGTSAQEGVIIVRIAAMGEGFDKAQQLLLGTEAEIRKRLDELVFGSGEEGLQHAVAARLTELGKTVATAESCTGGLVAKSLTDIPGSSEYFLEGVVTYSNQAKVRLLGVPEELIEEHGAVSPPVAEAMAVNCRGRSGSDYAVAITGIAGPGGGSAERPVGLVYIALADTDGCRIHEHRFASFDREVIRDRSCKTALNHLRLKLRRP